MASEGLRVQLDGFLHRWWNCVVMVIGCCGFGTSENPSHEQVDMQPFCCSTSDGRTASPSGVTSSGEGEWLLEIPKNIDPAGELHIPKNIDPAGEFNVVPARADDASQSTDAAATKPSAQCLMPTPTRSLEEYGNIIIAQRTPNPAIQDVRIGNEVWVVNTHLVNIKPDQMKSLNQDHVSIGVDAVSEDQVRKFGEPEMDNVAAGGLPEPEANPFKGPGHEPTFKFVSEGNVATFAMHVDLTKSTLVSTLEKRRADAVEGAKVHTFSTENSMPMGNESNVSRSKGSSSSSFM